MTIANLVTTIRIILAPVFMIFIINDQYKSALVVFIICVISDGADGMVARLLDQKSRLGTYLDPLADKLLLVATFIALSVRGFLPAWLTVLVIARDVMILLGVLVISLNRMEFRVKPSMVSKINTCFQFATATAVLSRNYLPLPSTFFRFLYYATALFTVSSGLHYLQYLFKIMGEGTGNSRAKGNGGPSA
ncbi:MAG: CDP-alcohol phosphatidyltransferase family protein [Deltaproteobacteria bacterium]|jgi:cardiolipin synthase